MSGGSELDARTTRHGCCGSATGSRNPSERLGNWLMEAILIHGGLSNGNENEKFDTLHSIETIQHITIGLDDLSQLLTSRCCFPCTTTCLGVQSWSNVMLNCPNVTSVRGFGVGFVGNELLHQHVAHRESSSCGPVLGPLGLLGFEFGASGMWRG